MLKFRVYEIHDNEKIYFNFELEPCEKKDAFIFEKVESWMDDEVVVEYLSEDEQIRLDGQPELFKLN